MKHQHQTFILGMIKHGDKIQAYRAAYPKTANDETARKSAERLLRHHPEVAAEIEESTAYIRQRAYAEAYREHVEQQKTPLLSMLKRREILAQIATCQMKVTRYVKCGDRFKMLFEDPRPRDIMQAMLIDAKFEDACNRMRNITDPVLSQFNIYIDGRPCDQPHLPPDPNLPPGIYMLPRRRKNQNHLSPAGGGVSSADGGGTLAQGKSQIENPGIISEQNILKDSFPVIREGGTNAVSDGRVDEGSTSAENQNPGIISEQNHTEHIHSTSPHPGDLGVPLAPGKSQIENSGIISEHLSRQDGEIELSPAACPDRFGSGGGEVRAGGGALAQEQNTQHLPLQGAGGADPLAASLYKLHLQECASAPPPHILTPEEVKALDEEYARQHADKQPKPSTFGKMYFKEKGINYDDIE